ncbi:Maltose O-acetyltransferase [Crateriforma conspicua]|uniref:Maltose O-acetyltransferase n=1 Tax=Crateriforma conspicua TaxID=2527996 RepID=A0A5C6FDU8_9PLAN|nr:WcaF family extracellular polysaccharide biosynthesis acetyltransferase [Crateriforma conspicua]TWU59660.1 Maltose O-acetyltransferase [Crateriforma conspicua]
MRSPSQTRLQDFDAAIGLDRGKPRWFEALWYLVKCFFFLSPLPFPSKLKCYLLRLFGAEVGVGVNIKPRVNIHFPWKLTVGNDCWLGEELFILNFEPVILGNDCCLSQRAFLCCGNHDYRDPTFAFRNAPITVKNGVWVGAQCFVGPGVSIGEETVVTAGSIVTNDLPANCICRGNPAISVGARWRVDNEA